MHRDRPESNESGEIRYESICSTLGRWGDLVAGGGSEFGAFGEGREGSVPWPFHNPVGHYPLNYHRCIFTELGHRCLVCECGIPIPDSCNTS